MSASANELEQPIESSISLKPVSNSDTFRIKPAPNTGNSTQNRWKWRQRLWTGNNKNKTK